MWPFRKRQPPQRAVPSPPFIDGAAWALGPGGSTYVSPQGAEALAAVACCVDLISQTVASLPAEVTLVDDTRATQPNHPLSKLIRQGCNGRETWSDFLTSLVSSALLRGNGLAELITDPRGQLVELRTVPFAQCTPWVDDAGELMFDYIPTLPPGAGQRRRLLADDVLLVKDRGETGYLGTSRLARSANALQHAVQTQVNSFAFLANAARPGGYLAAPGKVTEATATRLATDWDSNYGRGERYGKTAILPEGLQWQALSMLSSEDAQVVERLGYSVQDVSRVFSVPIFFLGDPHRATFASAREATRHLATHTIAPWVARIERAFAASVLSPRYRLCIDLGALLKSDPDAYAGSLMKYRQAGILSPNECREELGWPRSTEAGADSLAPPLPGIVGENEPPADALPPPAPDDGAPSKSKLNGHAATH